MAVNPVVKIEVRNPGYSRSLVQLPDDLTRLVGGPIQAPGVWTPDQDPRIINLYLSTVASDLGGGYLDLRPHSFDGPTQYISASFGRFGIQPIKTFVSPAGRLDGVDCQGSTVKVHIGASCHRPGIPPTDANGLLHIQLVHLDTDQIETVLGVATQALTSKTLQTFVLSRSVTRSWGTDERLLLNTWGGGTSSNPPT